MKRNIYLSLTLPLQFIVLNLLSNYPDVIEKIYSLNLYQILAALEQFAFGWLPFSFGDILYIVLIILILRWIYRIIRTRFSAPLKRLLQVFSTASIFYFLFHLLWGLNYYRPPLHQSLHLKASYTTEELYQLTTVLVEQTNALQVQLTGDKANKVPFDFTTSELNYEARIGYDNVFVKYPYLYFKFNRSKKSIFSLPLSYMGFSGYLNPLTNEAQYNAKMPWFSLPTTITHEMGHQLGFAKENEANFMAVLATIEHPNPYFNFAGHAFALQYCLSDLRKRAPEIAQQLLDKINPGVLKNYREVNTFWEAYKNPLEPGFKFFYNNYLKINNQPDGMKSYSYVVALLVNYYQNENAL